MMGPGEVVLRRRRGTAKTLRQKDRTRTWLRKGKGSSLYAVGATAISCGNLSGSLRRRKVRAYFAFFHFTAAGAAKVHKA